MNLADTTHSLLPAAAWLRVLEEEYLQEFLPQGGSCVRFVTGSPPLLQQLPGLLQRLAENHGCYFACLDPAELDERERARKLHATDQFFFSVTRDLNWKASAAQQARRLLRERGLELPEEPGPLNLDQVAQRNHLDRGQVQRDFQVEMTNRYVRDTFLGAEFRSALYALIRTQLFPEAVLPATEEVLLNWFRGHSTPGGAGTLKSVQV
ncbi:MAG: hypothetical protein FJX77_00155 [Armatimonadetes bacterium]|nr:hypothetical protein [Armatimonadota bacterium]